MQSSQVGRREKVLTSVRTESIVLYREDGCDQGETGSTQVSP